MRKFITKLENNYSPISALIGLTCYVFLVWVVVKGFNYAFQQSR